MSPKSLVLLVVVGLCATQMASADREARSVGRMMGFAKNKLAGLLANSEDAARTCMETVMKQIVEVENKVLDAGTEMLAKNGVELNLHDLAGLLKDNIKLCTNDETVKDEVKVILTDVASCVTKDVETLKSLINDMKNLWRTAQDLPATMQQLGNQCSAHAESDNPVPEEPLPIVDDAESFSLAVISDEPVNSESHHLSKRALWDVARVTRCMRSVTSLVKNDLVTIPGEIIKVASQAHQLYQSVQGGIAACVGKKVTENSAAIAQLGLKLGSCVAAGVSEGEDLDEVVAKNPSLAALRQLSGVAKNLKSMGDSGLLSKANKVAKLFG